MITLRDADRIADLLIELGGRTPWVLLWDVGEESDTNRMDILSSASPDAVAEIVCAHLLQIIRYGIEGEHTVLREQ